MSERLVGSPGFPADGSEERTPRHPPRRQPASVFPDLSSSPCVRDAACRPEQGPVRGPQVDCDAASRGTWHPPARRCTGSALRMLPGRLPCSSALVEGGLADPSPGSEPDGGGRGARSACGVRPAHPPPARPVWSGRRPLRSAVPSPCGHSDTGPIATGP